MRMNNNKKLTKKDLKKVYWRWRLASQTGWNYERMQGLGYCYSMLPVLQKLYPQEKELKEAMQLHLQFYNSEPAMSHLILGANVALEENQGLEAKEAVTAMKTGLMGPFAGIGDTIFQVIAVIVFGSIAAYMALNGSSAGIWIWFAWNFFMWFVKWKFTELGYVQGTKLVSAMEGRLKNITEAASILGLTVVGALIPSVVRPTVSAVFKSGEVTFEVQEMLDQIMPGLVPAILVFFVYWLLGRDKMTSTKAIWILLAISIVLGALGILA